MAEILVSYTAENNNVLSANSFAVDCMLLGISFMCIRKNHGPKYKSMELEPVLATSWNTGH